jgi:hypothetical protein
MHGADVGRWLQKKQSRSAETTNLISAVYPIVPSDYPYHRRNRELIYTVPNVIGAAPLHGHCCPLPLLSFIGGVRTFTWVNDSKPYDDTSTKIYDTSSAGLDFVDRVFAVLPSAQCREEITTQVTLEV